MHQEWRSKTYGKKSKIWDTVSEMKMISWLMIKQCEAVPTCAQQNQSPSSGCLLALHIYSSFQSSLLLGRSGEDRIVTTFLRHSWLTFENEDDKYALDSRYADKHERPTQHSAPVPAPGYKRNLWPRMYFHKGLNYRGAAHLQLPPSSMECFLGCP